MVCAINQGGVNLKYIDVNAALKWVNGIKLHAFICSKHKAITMLVYITINSPQWLCLNLELTTT